VKRAAALKIGIGTMLIAASWFQLVAPERVFQPPQDRVLGLPLVPVSVLGVCATLFTLGVIVASEGVCGAAGGTSLWDLVLRDPLLLLRLLACGAVAGLTLEIISQWLGRLWYYPYWTPWFYSLLVIPGFAFYWLSIVESFLAAKAVLDAAARPRPHLGTLRLWPAGAVTLGLGLALSIRWYAHRGFAFAVTGPAPTAPPFVFAVLAVIGVVLLSGALVTAAVRRYWVPFAAVLLSSLVVSVAMEVPNAVHQHWAYAHFPGPVSAGGLPWAMFAAWPFQYLVFLAVPSLFLPELAALFWRPDAARAASRS
jgi:hypothetical protein